MILKDKIEECYLRKLCNDSIVQGEQKKELMIVKLSSDD